MRLSRLLKEKRPQYQERHEKVIIQHDNGRPHVARSIKTYLETLKWEVLPHPSYSPDVALSDYHLLRSMTHDLAHQHFCSYEEVKKWIDSWIDSKDVSVSCSFTHFNYYISGGIHNLWKDRNLDFSIISFSKIDKNTSSWDRFMHNIDVFHVIFRNNFEYLYCQHQEIYAINTNKI